MRETASARTGGLPYHWLAFATVSVGTFMGTMDMSMTNIALPTLSASFGAPPEVVLWVTLIYMLISVGIMLTVGSVADRVGRRRLYLLGFSVFTLGLGLCSIAPTLPLLLAGRAVQALGGAMLIGNSNAVLATAFPPEQRGKALGLLEAIVGAGLMVGPSLGGLLLERFDWHSLFFTRLPLGLVGLAMAWAVIKDPPRQPARGAFDYAGAVTLFIGLAALMLGINRGPSWGWAAPATLGLGAAAAVMLSAFFVIERRAAVPVLDLALFRSRPFAVSNAVMFLYFLPFSSVAFLIPFFLIQGLGYSSGQAGSFLIIIPFLMLTMSPFTGGLSDRFGARAMTVIGLALLALGLVLLHLVGIGAQGWDVAWRVAVSGVGAGLFLTPIYNSIMGSAPPEQVGVASALIATVRSVGAATGLALAGAILQARRESHAEALSAAATLSGDALTREALARGVQDTFLVMAGVAALGFLLSAALGQNPARAGAGHGDAAPSSAQKLEPQPQEARR